MNITTFYGAFVESFDGELSASRFGAPRICVLMEYCEGGSLDGVSRRIRQMGFGFVSEKVMGKIAHGILLGLDYLHSVQVIHRGEFYLSVCPLPIAFCPWRWESN